jgi:hypothetical protein
MAGNIVLATTTDDAAAVDAVMGTTTAPVVPEAPQAPETEKQEPAESVVTTVPSPEEDTDPDDESGLPDKRPNKKAVIDRLKWDRRNERQKRIALEAELARARTQPPQPQPLQNQQDALKPPTFEKPRPQIKDFPDYSKFQEASDKWTEEKVDWQLQQRDARYAAEKQAEANAAVATEHYARIRQYESEHPDYIESRNRVMSDPELTQLQNQTTQMMAAHAMHSSLGPQLLHYLADHKADYLRMAGMSVPRAMVELGKIEAKLEAESQVPAPKPVVKKPASPAAPPAIPAQRAQTGPPPPISQLGGGTVTAADSSLDKMSFRDFANARNKTARR